MSIYAIRHTFSDDPINLKKVTLIYRGLGLSLKKTFVTIINNNGTIIKEDVVATDVDSLTKYLNSHNYYYKKIGIESGQL